MENPVKIQHRVFNEFGETTRLEYDANVVKELWGSTDRTIVAYLGDVATRMLIVSDQESDFSVQIAEYIGTVQSAVPNGVIEDLPPLTLTNFAPVVVFNSFDDLEALEFNDLIDYGRVITTIETEETIVSVASATGPCAVYRQFRTKQLLIDIPLFGRLNPNVTSPFASIKIMNLLSEEISYKIILLEVL